jgi:hypothetical protein
MRVYRASTTSSCCGPQAFSVFFEGDPVSAEDPVDRSLGRHNLELLWFAATSFKRPISIGIPAG